MTGVASTGTARKRSRREWHALFVAARERGATGLQIAERYGVGHTFVYSVLNDPDGSKDRARKQSYGGTCVDCGARTCGNDGRENAPERCAACAAEHQHANRVWTREAIIEAIQRWAREHDGTPPSATDWARQPPDWAPFSSQCYYENVPGKRRNPFRYWADAIEAAGFPRPQIGHYERNGSKGLGATERDVLALAEDGPLTASWLVENLGIGRIYAGKVLRRLAARGLLERDSEPLPERGAPYVYRHKTQTL